MGVVHCRIDSTQGAVLVDNIGAQLRSSLLGGVVADDGAVDGKLIPDTCRGHLGVALGVDVAEVVGNEIYVAVLGKGEYPERIIVYMKSTPLR